jgi:urease accessory protein
MIRATEILPSGHWDRAGEADTIELPHDGRHRRRVAMRATNDTVFLLDPAEAGLLRDGDGLKLEDGRVVRVVAASEPVAEVTAGDAQQLARIAWYLGNRHVPAQMLADRLRIPRDRGVEEFATSLGAQVSHVEAKFEPEGGLHAQQAAHAHGHHHGGHAHHHDHEHGPDCGHDHDHGHRHDR